MHGRGFWWAAVVASGLRMDIGPPTSSWRRYLAHSTYCTLHSSGKVGLGGLQPDLQSCGVGMSGTKYCVLGAHAEVRARLS